jgi:hypothetical protein
MNLPPKNHPFYVGSILPAPPIGRPEQRTARDLPLSLPAPARGSWGEGWGGRDLGKQHAIALALAGAYVCTGR